MASNLSKLIRAMALCCVLVSGAFAHHNGTLYFDGSKTLRIENATVVSLVIINPHSRLVFTIENEQGELEEWRAETQSHNALRRKGIRPDLVQPGDVVTVIGNPSRSGTLYLRMRQTDPAEWRYGELLRRWARNYASRPVSEPLTGHNSTISAIFL